MNDKIIKRIEELSNEINSLLRHKMAHIEEIKKLEDGITGKTASIVELKQLLESDEE